MDFRELATFMKLVECGHFTQTAKALFISQPTASTHIKALEDEFGMKLFVKGPDGYHTTEAGTILAGYARRILEYKEDCHKTLGRMKEERIKTLYLGSTTAGAYILPSIMEKLRAQEANTKLFFSISNKSETYENLDRGLVDAILASFSKDYAQSGKYDFKYVGSTAFVLACSTKNPLWKQEQLPIDALKNETFLIREEGSATRTELLEWLKNNKLDSNNIIEVWQAEAILRAIEENAGISLIPTMSLRADNSLIKALDIDGFPAKSQFYVVTPKTNNNRALIHSFSQLVKDTLIEHDALYKTSKRLTRFPEFSVS